MVGVGSVRPGMLGASEADDDQEVIHVDMCEVDENSLGEDEEMRKDDPGAEWSSKGNAEGMGMAFVGKKEGFVGYADSRNGVIE